MIPQRRILIRRPLERKSDRLLESSLVLSEIQIRHLLKLPIPELLIHDILSAIYEAPALRDEPRLPVRICPITFRLA